MSTPGVRDSFSQALPETGPGSKKRRRWFLGVSGVLLAICLLAFAQVLQPFVLALVLAYVLSPLVAMGEQLRFRGQRIPRGLIVLGLYSVLVGLLVSLVTLGTPRLAAEFQRLNKEAPRAIEVVRKEWLPELERRLNAATAPYLPQRVSEESTGEGASARVAPDQPAAIDVRVRPEGGYEVLLPPGGLRIVPDGDRAFSVEAGRPRDRSRADVGVALREAIARTIEDSEQSGVALLQTAQRFIGKLVRGVFSFMMMLVVSAYLLVTTERIFEFARSLYAPSRRGDFDDLVRRIDRGLSGVVRGQLIICVINGILSAIGFYMLGLKYAGFLTILAAVMSIIPIFGSILSTIPAVAVALPQGGVPLALLVLGWIVAIHQLEANLLNPKIMGDSARVHPVLVVFALLAGEHAAGLMGALLAVPVLSITQTLFLYLRERFLGVPRSASVPPTRIDTEPATAADLSRAGG